MKNMILIVGGVITILLAFLWYFDKITEPMFTICSAILTFFGYLFVNSDKKKKNPETTKMKQKSGSNSTNIQVGGDYNNGK